MEFDKTNNRYLISCSVPVMDRYGTVGKVRVGWLLKLDDFLMRPALLTCRSLLQVILDCNLDIWHKKDFGVLVLEIVFIASNRVFWIISCICEA